MVYGRYIDILSRVYKATNITEGHHIVEHLPSGKRLQKASENGHRNSGFTQLQNGGFVHSYVSLPEGTWVLTWHIAGDIRWEF